MFSKVEFLVATGRRVALRGWMFDIGTYWLLTGCNYSFVDLWRGGDKFMFVHFCNQDWKIFYDWHFGFVSRGWRGGWEWLTDFCRPQRRRPYHGVSSPSGRCPWASSTGCSARGPPCPRSATWWRPVIRIRAHAVLGRHWSAHDWSGGLVRCTPVAPTAPRTLCCTARLPPHHSRTLLIYCYLQGVSCTGSLQSLSSGWRFDDFRPGSSPL